MNPLCACALFVVCSVACAADTVLAGATTNTAPQPSSSPAETAWGNLEAQARAEPADPLAIPQYCASLLAGAHCFLEQYPTDTSAKDAKFYWLAVADRMRRENMRGAPTEEEIATQLNTWETDVNVPESERGSLRAVQIQVSIGDASNSPDKWKAIVAQIENYQKQYGVTPATTKEVGQLRLFWYAVAEKMRRKNMQGAPLEEEIAKQVTTWETDVNAAESEQRSLRVMQLKFSMQDAGDSPDKWNAIDAQIENYQKQYGLTPTTTEEVVKLRSAEISITRELPDQSRYQALLKKLEADPMMRQVATIAHKDQARADKMDQLKLRPMDLRFTAVDGTEFDLAKLRGKVVMIDFWATWCGPCCQEVPNVVAAYRKYHEQGFEIVGVSLDQDKDNLLAFTKQHEMVWPQYFDGKGWQNSVSSSYGIEAVPAMWLVGKDGKLVTTEGREDLAGKVEKLLQTP